MIKHETITVERVFSQPPATVFTAFAQSEQREKWSPPSTDEVVKIESSDFVTGGYESAVCGPKDNPSYALKVQYHLVEENSRILFSEELWDKDKLLTVALITVELESHTQGTVLTLTDQLSSMIGDDGISGHSVGYTKALENLAQFLT